MKRCLVCQASFAGADWRCPVCGHGPPLAQGFPSFANPFGHDGFRPELFSELVELEDGHFWFRARNRLIIDSLARYFPGCRSFLEIGCGTGYVLSGLACAFPGISLTGSEFFAEGLPFAAARVPGASLLQADARELPFVEEFDAIGAFDVLEHIDNDRLVLAEIYRALLPGGGLLLTVPQHPWLWSDADASAHHVRRYTRAELLKKVEEVGFRVLQVGSFVTLLLPILALMRLRPGRSGDALAELRIGRSANAFCAALMVLERGLLRCGLRLPVGGSLLLVAQRPIS